MNIFQHYEEFFINRSCNSGHLDIIHAGWKQVIEKHPSIEFGHRLNLVGPGWWQILDNAFFEIEKTVQENNTEQKFRVLQIKEKFGGLSFYRQQLMGEKLESDISDIVSAAVTRAGTTCEVCGNRGESRHLPWVKTLCEHHYKLKCNTINESI